MNTKYTADHEWLKIDGNIATVGITDHAQDALGDIVYVELPTVGKTFGIKSTVCVVESVKAAADVYMPISGEITEVNTALDADPALLNRAPMNEGWIFKVRLSNPAELSDLMDEAAYRTFSQ